MLGFHPRLLGLLLASGLCGAVLPAEAAPLKARLSQLGGALHLEALGINEWDYKLEESEENGKKRVSLELPLIDQASIEALEKWQGPLVERIVVEKQPGAGKVKLIFIGHDLNLETFDYLTDQPLRLIVDIFEPAGKAKTKATAQKAEKKSKKPEGLSKQVAISKAEERKPASDALVVGNQGIDLAQIESSKKEVKNGIFDGADPDYSRFSMTSAEIKEESIIKSKKNIYLPFPMLELEDQHLKRLLSNPPVYEISKRSGEENKFARLLVTLFNRKRFAVFLKSLKWFEKKYPNSEYNEMLAFMHADLRYQMWQESGKGKDYEAAIARYQVALEQFPDSPLAERTIMLMGFSALSKGDAFSTIRIFQKHLENAPAGENSDIMKFALAKSLMMLNKYRDAEKIYRDLKMNGQSERAKTEGAYLLGDVYIRENKQDQALESYTQAIAKHSDQWENYPNAFFNSAEALFWKGHYKDSLDKYRDFLMRFPANEHAGYAMTRIGELLEILGAERKRVLGAYLETHFRYGENPGASVARIRFLSDRIQGMKEKEVQDAVTEIEQITESSNLPKIKEFSEIMIADGYWRRKQHIKAAELLINHYRNNPTTAHTEILTTRIVRYINDAIAESVAKGDSVEALKTHAKYFETWLKNSNRIDTPFYLGKAFEEAGIPTEAERIYKDAINKLYAIQGTKHEKERGIFEKLPSLDAINLRLAAVSYSQKKAKQAYRYLQQIKKPENLELDQQLERVDVASRLLEEQGDNETAKRYLHDLVETWRGEPLKAAPAYLRYAELAKKTGHLEDASTKLQILLNLQTDTDLIDEDIHARTLMLMAEVKQAQGRPADAITALNALLEKHEGKRNLSASRYTLGKLYLDQGRLQKAKETWDKLEKQENSMWWNLAREQMDSRQWKEDYDKYIERIPAMAESQK